MRAWGVLKLWVVVIIFVLMAATAQDIRAEMNSANATADVSAVSSVAGMVTENGDSVADSTGDYAGFGESKSVVVPLPGPSVSGGMSVEEAIHQRRSVRSFSSAPIKLSEVSQLLWAAQGITGSGRFRAAPSAGATYPLEVYVVAGNVDNLDAGIYRYEPVKHQLVLSKRGDHQAALASAALGQQWVKDAPASLVIGGVVARTAARYGAERANRYMLLEAGHAAENVLLQALSCHLGAVMIGAFVDDSLSDLLDMNEGEQPLAIIPVGH